jgi:hypothetical protein
MPMLPEHIKLDVPEQFESLVVACCNEWAKEANIKGHLLGGGHSGAIVLRVDIAEGQTRKESNKSESPERVKSGYYILKLSAPSPEGYTANEAQKHQAARKWDESFAKDHIPELEREYHSQEGDALLYRIAGDSLYAYLPADYSTRDLFTPACSQLVTDLLDHWVEPELIEKFPYELLEMWLGRRLEPGASPACQALLEKKWGKDDRCSEGTVAILNPFRFYELARKQLWEAWRYFQAGLHADLHRGNVLLHVTDPGTEPYWLIDFCLSRKGPAGYDQAYLEVDLVISSLQGRNPAMLVEVLNALRAAERHRKEVLPLDAQVQQLYLRLQEIRNAVISWRTRRWPNRHDDIDRQFCLARVAAGINWASKKKLNEDSHLEAVSRYLALCYAGLAAQEYLDKFVHDRESTRFADHDQSIPLISAPAVEEKGEDNSETITVDETLWRDFLRGTDNFSAQAGRFVLVAEPQQQGNEYLQALGSLPWSVIIDLDPFSDDKGLRHYAEPILHNDHHVQFCSNENDVRKMEVNFAQGLRPGAAWLMAAGWERGGEKHTDYVTWFEEKPEAIRLLIKKLMEAAGLDPIYVLVLPGGSLDPDDPAARLADVINAIAQTARGQAKFILLGRGKKLDGRLKVRSLLPIPLEIPSCLQRMQKQFGLNKRQMEAKVPGSDGWRSIPLHDLRAMQENMVVLHSDILNEEADQEKEWPPTSFWRGSPPTWHDFQAGIDIKRLVHRDLVRDLREVLKENRNYTVKFHHRPGAGGTTAALRAAWDLHTEYPTAVLTYYSSALVHRLENLYMIAQKPVLLIADASELRDADREKLYLELSRSPARVVILYVGRVLPGGNVPHPGLDEPMQVEEAEWFREAYTALTNDPDKQRELGRITYTKGLLERYRTPFFYGLITFERGYFAVDKYVETHLSGVLGRQRDILQYLALMTIYTNGGIPETLLGRLLHLSSDKKPSLSMLLQEGPAHLVTRDMAEEGLRMMHQLVAEQVLERLIGADWRNQLHKLSQAFIEEVAAVTDPNSQFVRDLFRQLFVDRYDTSDGIDERPAFSPLIEEINASCGWHAGLHTLEVLTQRCSEEAHFWNHLGRYHIYRCKRYLDPRQAEMYLERAIKLTPRDDIHHHTLGVVRRVFVYQVLDDESLSELSPSALLERIKDDFDRAVDAFRMARDINPESVYSYVSHIQMIIQVGKRLKSAAGVESVAKIAEYSAAEWVNEQVSEAWNLLEDASRLHGTFRANTLYLRISENEADEQNSTYLIKCREGLYELFGNFDTAVHLWEVNFSPTSNNIERRALASAYDARAEHQKRPMTLSERRRVVDLTTELLESAKAHDGDYHLWFKAYSQLPGFDAQEALSKLSEWANRGFSSWLASYYMYALQFSLWYFNEGISPIAMRDALAQYKGKIVGRRRYCYLWFGMTLSPCSLIPDTDLGEWIRERPRGKNFWKDTRLLRPVNGIINHIARDSSESSSVLIKGKGDVEAIILSYKDSFSPYQDEKQPVHFYLGFAPNGLQAWEVEKGHIIEEKPGATTGKETLFTYPEELEISSEEQREQWRRRLIEETLVFAHDLIVARAAQEIPLALNELESCVEAALGVDELLQKVGYQDMEELLRTKGKTVYTFPLIGKDMFVSLNEVEKKERQLSPARLRGQIKLFYPDQGWGLIDDWTPKLRYFRTTFVLPTDREKLKKSGYDYLVQFIPDSNDKGPIATGIQLLDEMLTLTPDGLIEPGRLRPVVEAKVVEILEDTWRKNESISLRDLEKKLTEIFRGKTLLTDRLGVKHIFQFVQNIDGVLIQGNPPASNQVVRLWPLPLFDRPKQETIQDLARSGISWEENRRNARALVIQWAEKAALWNAELKATEISTRLEKRFPGTGKLAYRLGYTRFSDFLEGISEIEIFYKGSEQYIRRRR